MNYGICPAKKLEKMKDIIEIEDAILTAARQSLKKQGFLEIRPPILAPITDPGLRGAKQFETDFYGEKWKVTSSMIMHKILAASSLGKIFAISPCARKEPLDSKYTGRHLCEFWQIDVEMGEASKEQAMEVAETLIRDVMEAVAPLVKKKLGLDLRIPELPFKRIPHSQVIETAKILGFDMDKGKEIPWEIEKQISLQFKDPFFVTEYPIGSRGFYDKISDKKLLAFDMIYPGGFGEACSGSQREDKLKLVIEKLKHVGEDPETYKWYLDLLDRGVIIPTAGFGFGLERLTRFICSLDKIEEAAIFPKLPGEVTI